MSRRRNSPDLLQIGAHLREQIGRPPPLPRQDEMPGMETDDAAALAKRIHDGRKIRGEEQKKAARTFEFQIRALELPQPWSYIDSKGRKSHEYRYCNDPDLKEKEGLEPRDFRADYAWPEYQLLVEIQGGIWSRGAHGHPVDIVRNIEKSNYAAFLSFFVLQITTDDVKNAVGIALLQRMLVKRGWKPPQDSQ